jgi:transcriptional regulator with XRE-family HTH domain
VDISIQAESIGARLRTLRLHRGWTQLELGFYSKVTCSDISKIECGRLKATAAQLKKLADALEVPRHELIPDQEMATR